METNKDRFEQPRDMSQAIEVPVIGEYLPSEFPEEPFDEVYGANYYEEYDNFLAIPESEEDTKDFEGE